VSLCGSIPRKDMALSLKKSHSPLMNISPSDLNVPLCDSLSEMVSRNPSMARMQHDHSHAPIESAHPTLEPPSWAVPARGEARLEPVCEAVGRQTSVDLTARACFRIGRSPNSDVQLMHATSSRKHAMLFHHSNSSCYIVDCGSAHGTYVNGMRIASPPRGGGVIPYRVRRGAMVRFGGPGAPCFVLKSFSSQTKDIADPLVEPSCLRPNLDSSNIVCFNTRINALGRSNSEESLPDLPILCKRTFQTIDADFNDEEPCLKRTRCSSPPLSPEQPMRLVSPDLLSSSSRKRRVTFSNEPPSTFYPSLVTPYDLSDDES